MPCLKWLAEMLDLYVVLENHHRYVYGNDKQLLDLPPLAVCRPAPCSTLDPQTLSLCHLHFPFSTQVWIVIKP